MNSKPILYIACLACIGSCDDNENQKTAPLNFNYTFASGPEEWTGDFADYPQGSESFYELGFEYSNLPAPLDQNKGALKQTGNNHSDDLFMFVKRKITGLGHHTTYKVTITVEFASNVADGMVGVGGSPGENVAIKVGATAVEPMKILNASNYYRLNIDKGNQSQGGTDMIVIGDFSNDTNQSVYTLKTVSNQTPFEVTTGHSGELWLIAGTDSGFEATTTIYYNKIEAKLEK